MSFTNHRNPTPWTRPLITNLRATRMRKRRLYSARYHRRAGSPGARPACRKLFGSAIKDSPSCDVFPATSPSQKLQKRFPSAYFLREFIKEDWHRSCSTVAPRRNSVTSCDSWFAALDERRIGYGPASWVAHVTAVRTIGEDSWIQVQSADNPAHSLILRVGPDATLDQVVTVLMMTDFDSIPEVVPVSHAA